MQISAKKLILIIGLLVLVLAVGVAGFFVAQMVAGQQGVNRERLEQFGIHFATDNPNEVTVGIMGQTQLPPTFAEEKLSPGERVIRSLVQERENLLAEKQTLHRHIETLEERIRSLEADREFYSHFIPETFGEELNRVENFLNEFLNNRVEAERFGSLRKQVMAAAGRMEYKRFVEENRLILERPQREHIVHEYLTGFIFCVGDAIQLAANSIQEEREILAYFHHPEEAVLSEALRGDLDTVLTPCQLNVRQQLQASL
ncbi:hypothetical protein [Nitrincola alkalilacustris]|uniref:hypothetical protein n=1 Tax=Nitrincola alkalilacustris TaxID=1571224 RepID=UPI00124E3C76|nr:hypothetical protein [Nitrincola alkalilacustris]